jgi:hypothetical protein
MSLCAVCDEFTADVYIGDIGFCRACKDSAAYRIEQKRQDYYASIEHFVSDLCGCEMCALQAEREGY